MPVILVYLCRHLIIVCQHIFKRRQLLILLRINLIKTASLLRCLIIAWYVSWSLFSAKKWAVAQMGQTRWRGRRGTTAIEDLCRPHTRPTRCSWWRGRHDVWGDAGGVHFSAILWWNNVGRWCGYWEHWGLGTSPWQCRGRVVSVARWNGYLYYTVNWLTRSFVTHDIKGVWAALKSCKTPWELLAWSDLKKQLTLF